MLFSGLLQQRGWRFDLTSALIGAAIALLLAGIIYQRREQIKEFALKFWSPVAMTELTDFLPPKFITLQPVFGARLMI